MARLPDIPGTIAVLQVRPLLDALPALGVDVARVLASAGLSEKELAEPSARLRAGFEFVIWEAIEALSGDPLIALRVADRIALGSLGAFEYLLRNSATLREATERAGRFERVLDDLTRITLVEDGELAAIRFTREGGYPQPPHSVECLFAVLLRVCKELVPGLRAREVRFVHRVAGDPRAFARELGCPVVFGSAYDELVLPRAMLNLPLCAADPRLGSVLEEHVQRLLAQVPNEDPFVRRARGALLSALRAGSASLEALAAELHVSARTLRRRLDEHGTSYKALLDELRRELAYHYLEKTDDPVDGVASRLGFTEPSTFYRAFKRWSGTTPLLHRERKRTG